VSLKLYAIKVLSEIYLKMIPCCNFSVVSQFWSIKL
jgi:hypothetical protein